ncbi:MAG: regulatory protein RecX [Bacteroidales bacterium]|jgi:regulatory protein|nr:regulatory protein RecX [Bacteroidales bacterium]MDD4703171.1 regulatory protein RecX [Bacteroidales bacterium]MDX9797746.1 regulatory protein RecX [Bacteroidales bacterium]
MKDNDKRIRDAFSWAKAYCSKQERSHRQVVNGLLKRGLEPWEAEDVLAELISENYVSESRFAQLYAKSKFNQNQWGRKKIQHELRLMGLSESNIQLGLDQIPEHEYKALLEKLCLRKMQSLGKQEPSSIKQKTIAFLLSKGFEYEEIVSVYLSLV